MLMSGTAPTQVQHFALGFVETHAVHRGPILQPVQVIFSNKIATTVD